MTDSRSMTTAVAARRRGVARPLVASLTVTTSGVLPGFLVSAMAVQLRAELALTASTYGLMLAAFFATGGLGSPLGGRLVDRLGWRRSVVLAGGLSLVTLVGLAAIVRTPTMLLGFLVLGGCTLAITGPTGNLVLAREMPSHRLGLVFGIKQTAIPIATMFAGLALPAVALTVGWRWAFMAGVAFPLIAVATAGRPGPRRAGRASAQRVRLRGGQGLMLVTLGGGLAMTAAGGMAAFLVTYAVHVGVAEGTAGALYAAASMAGLLVRIVAGGLADRTRTIGFRPVAVMMALGGLGYVALALHSPLLLVLGTGLAFTCGWAWAGLMSYGLVRTFPDHPAEATGTVQFGTTVGVAAGPLVLGFTVEHGGFGAMWLVAAACAAMAAVVVEVARRRLTPVPS